MFFKWPEENVNMRSLVDLFSFLLFSFLKIHIEDFFLHISSEKLFYLLTLILFLSTR